MKNALITILSVLVIALSALLVYDKLIKTSDKKENNVPAENSTIEKNECKKADENMVETRVCNGVYSGSVSGNHSPGMLTVELKSNGVYLVDGYETGKYIIVENALLLKNPPDVCGPGEVCNPSYIANFISEDCSTISWLYGSDRFILTKQN